MVPMCVNNVIIVGTFIMQPTQSTLNLPKKKKRKKNNLDRSGLIYYFRPKKIAFRQPQQKETLPALELKVHVSALHT